MVKNLPPVLETWVQSLGREDPLEKGMGTQPVEPLCGEPQSEAPQPRKVKVKVKLLSRVRLFATPWTVDYQASLSMEFSRQEYWSGLPFPSAGDLADPGTEPGSLAL